ncbi:MAG TPA: SRPBCC family protein [Gemmatimonadaceae bacterium]|nr:SRPBCC family protein [Gemmatimonadaceae bacterium]
MTSSAQPPLTVRVTRRFDATPERVFDAWLDPRTAGKWLFATPTGRMVRVDIDARVGGAFTFVDRRNGEDVAHEGEYLDIDRPRRLVFLFAVPRYSSQRTRIEVEIEPHGTGCVLTLAQDGVPPEMESRTVAGWSGVLDALARTIGAD